MHLVTGAIIHAFFRTYNALGYGYLESIYTAALEYELQRAGCDVSREFATRVMYDGVELGFHRLDMVVERCVVVEIKATPVLHPIARRQLCNYLRATSLETGVLLHYGPQPRFQRIQVPNAPRHTLVSAPSQGEIAQELRDDSGPASSA